MTGRLKANIADVPWLSWSVFTFHMHQHCSRLREEMMTLQTSNWDVSRAGHKGANPWIQPKVAMQECSQESKHLWKRPKLQAKRNPPSAHIGTLGLCQEYTMQMPLARDVYVCDYYHNLYAFACADHMSNRSYLRLASKLTWLSSPVCALVFSLF